MIVEWNDRALASVEQQRETYHSARGYTRTKLAPGSWEWSIVGVDHVALRVPCKLQALVYDILPSNTAVFSYTIGSRKLSANEQYFVGAPTVVSLLQTTQMIWFCVALRPQRRDGLLGTGT